MSLDNLLGLLFFIFFIVLPAIQSFSRRRPPLDPNDLDPDLPQPQNRPNPTQSTSAPSNPPARQAPPQPQRQVPPQRQAPPQPQRQTQPPAQRPAAPPARPVPPKPQPPKAPPTPAARSSIPPAPPSPFGEFPSSETQGSTKPSRIKLQFNEDAILNGIVWREILSEPRGQHWQRRMPRKPK